MDKELTPEKLESFLHEQRITQWLEFRIKAKLKIILYFDAQRKTKRNLMIKNDLIKLIHDIK